MEKQLIDAFDQIKMSEECAEKISRKLSHQQTAPRRFRYVAVTSAACLLLIVAVLYSNTTVVQALQTVGENLKNAVLDLIAPNKTVTEQFTFEYGNYVIENGVHSASGNYTIGTYVTGSVPSWLKAEEDGLFFDNGEERIEISSLISTEVPFTYIFTDSQNIRHYIAVGGIYGTGENALNTVGWCEWMQKSPYDMQSWLGGYAKGNQGNGAENSQVWKEKAKEILGVPWS